MIEHVDHKIHEVAKLLKAAGAKEVYLFGSAASGSLQDDSDVDMAVAGLPPEKYFRVISDSQRLLGRPLDLIDLDEPNPFTRYLTQEGELRQVE